MTINRLETQLTLPHTDLEADLLCHNYRMGLDAIRIAMFSEHSDEQVVLKAYRHCVQCKGDLANCRRNFEKLIIKYRPKETST
jgi:hypothetical protein